MHLCTDNGAMIAMAAAMRVQTGQAKQTLTPTMQVSPRWALDSIVFSNSGMSLKQSELDVAG
jgi:N6-L-threonylcarbamoyladenine synthase